MKILILFFLLVLTFSLTAQIAGTVVNKDNVTVNFATIYNLTQKTFCITNSEGVFMLEGNVGDSIRIQHLNYFTQKFVIEANSLTYLLNQKSYKISEISISASFASQLLKKSCENTYKKLGNVNFYRGYLNYLLLENNDTAQMISVDLDVIHRKLNDLKQSEKINSFSVQERVVKDSVKTGNLSIRKYIGFPLNRFSWEELPNAFNYVKTEDSMFVKLYFLSKKSVLDSIMNWEVIINKKDSCLHSIAITNKNPIINKKSKEVIKNYGTYQYIRYGYANNNYYLAEFSNGFIVGDPHKENFSYKGSIYYITYQTGKNIKKRKNGLRIPENIFTSNLFRKDRYYDDFWKKNDTTKLSISDFDYLFNFVAVE